MSTFESLSKLDKIALCARATGLEIFNLYGVEQIAGEGAIYVVDTHTDCGHRVYEPYNNKAQWAELVEKMGLSISGPPGLFDVYTREYGKQFSACSEDLATAICDCVARMQWEKERG